MSASKVLLRAEATRVTPAPAASSSHPFYQKSETIDTAGVGTTLDIVETGTPITVVTAWRPKL